MAEPSRPSPGRCTSWSRAAVLVVVAALLAAGGAGRAAAQDDVEDLRAEREDLRRQAADAAAALDALAARDAELQAAIDAISAHIELQESRIEAVEADIEAAEQVAARARDEAAAIGDDIESIKERLRRAAIDAFVSPRPDPIGELETSTLLEAELKRSYIDTVVGDEVDLLAQLRAASAAQDAATRRADDAVADAEARRAELADRRDELAASRAEVEQLQAQVQVRVADWAAVGAEMAAADAAITADIRRAEQEAQRRAEEAEAARKAAEEAAADPAAAADDPAAPTADDPAGTADPAATTDPVAADPGPAPTDGFVITHRPVPGMITSPFGTRVHPIFRTVRHHYGVDFDANTGDPIVAAADGEVITAGRMTGYGNTVVIFHGNGTTTLYAHQSRIDVSVGQTVHGGDVIGRVGSSGWATGPHLHFEVRIDGAAVDPAPYLP